MLTHENHLDWSDTLPWILPRHSFPPSVRTRLRTDFRFFYKPRCLPSKGFGPVIVDCRQWDRVHGTSFSEDSTRPDPPSHSTLRPVRLPSAIRRYPTQTGLTQTRPPPTELHQGREGCLELRDLENVESDGREEWGCFRKVSLSKVSRGT